MRVSVLRCIGLLSFVMVSSVVVSSSSYAGTLKSLAPGNSVGEADVTPYNNVNDFKAAFGDQFATLDSNFTGSEMGLSYSGILSSTVYKLGSVLTFVYKLTVTEVSDGVESSPSSFSVAGFAKFITNISYRDDANSNVDFGRVSRNNTGDILSFNFVEGSPPLVGDSTVSYIVQTNADSYIQTNGGRVAPEPNGVGVLVPNPEPTTMVLAAIGLVPVAGMIRSRRRKNEVSSTVVA